MKTKTQTRPLFAGLDCLPGQGDLFLTDGVAEAEGDPLPPPGTPIPPGVCVCWAGQNDTLVVGELLGKELGKDCVRVRPTRIIVGNGGTGRPANGEPKRMPRELVRVDYWPRELAEAPEDEKTDRGDHVSTWRSTPSPNRRPTEIAAEFVNEYYPGREVAAFTGEWIGLEYAGSFQLAGGNRLYRITGDRYGNYEITY
jgi:hypothetical protein